MQASEREEMAELERKAAVVGVDLRRHLRCARCEEPLKGQRTVICEFAPYARRRLDAACMKVLLNQSIGDEGAES